MQYFAYVCSAFGMYPVHLAICLEIAFFSEVQEQNCSEPCEFVFWVIRFSILVQYFLSQLICSFCFHFL